MSDPRRRTAALVAAAATVAALAVGAPAAADEAARTTDRSAADRGGRVCYSQLDHDLFSGIMGSQDFEPAFDQYDAEAADDFQVERRCRVRSVIVVGNYGAGGVGPTRSQNLTFYRDGGGAPGKIVRAMTVIGEDTFGSFEMPVKPPLRLRPGRTYWVSVQVNMDFAVGGQWLVEGRTVVDGAPAVWRNPGDGFGTGCLDWAPLYLCRGDQPPLDLMFEISTRHDPSAQGVPSTRRS